MSRKHKRVNRRNIIKTLSAAGVLGLAGCSGDGGDGNDDNTGDGGDGGDTDTSGETTSQGTGEWPDYSGQRLHMLTGIQNQKEIFDAIGEDFKEATGLEEFKVEVVGMNNQRQRVIQLVQAGDPPDIVQDTQTLTPLYVNSDLALDVSDMMTDISDRIGAPSDEARVQLDGKDYFVPFWHNISSWWWRGDLIEEEGYSRSDFMNADWDLAIEAAEKLHDPENNINGTYVPAGTGSHSTFHLMAWLYTNGGSVCTWEGDRMVVNFDKGKNRTRMIETLEMLKERYQYAPQATDSSWDTAANAIPNGNTACKWYLGFRPKIRSIQNDREFAPDVHVGPMPSKRSRQTVASTDGVVPINGENPEAAQDFLRFMMRPKYIVNILASITPVHNVPAYPGINDSDVYQDAIADVPWNNESMNVAEDIERYTANREFVRPRIFDTQPPNPYSNASYASEPLWSLPQDVLLDDMDPEDAIDQRAPELQEKIDTAADQ